MILKRQEELGGDGCTLAGGGRSLSPGRRGTSSGIADEHRLQEQALDYHQANVRRSTLSAGDSVLNF